MTEASSMPLHGGGDGDAAVGRDLHVTTETYLGGEKPRFKSPPTFEVYNATLFAAGALLATCVSVLLVVAYWLWGNPSLHDVKELAASFGGTAAEQQVRAADMWTALRQEHATTAAEVAKVLITGILLPILTLLLGYAFGSRRPEKDTG